jgi:predicted dehydrogenase
MARKIRWGIIGTGKAAGLFAQGLRATRGAELLAVASRSAASAQAFALRFSIPRSYASYAELTCDPDVEVVHIATPHTFHMEHAILCLKADKAVLCEKPFTISAEQARKVISAARKQKRFLMEGMWTRFIPLTRKVCDWLKQDRIGSVRMLTADFGYGGKWRAKSRVLNPELGGGALLDVGVYTVSLASMVFGGQPRQITSLAHIGRTGVDEQAGIIFAYPAGQLAVLACACRTQTVHEARIYGTKGHIRIHPPFWNPVAATVSMAGKKDRTICLPPYGNGFNYEAAEVGRCLRLGRLQSDIMPLDETLAIMKTMDRIRARWKLWYPCE